MSISAAPTLTALCQYLDATAGCGHTRTAIEGAATQRSLVVVASVNGPVAERYHAEAKNPHVLPLESARHLRVTGERLPLVVDNQALRMLLGAALAAIRKAEGRLVQIFLAFEGVPPDPLGEETAVFRRAALHVAEVNRLRDLEAKVKAALTEQGDDLCYRDLYNADVAALVGVDWKPEVLDEATFVDINCREFHRCLVGGQHYVAPSVPRADLVAAERQRDAAICFSVRVAIDFLGLSEAEAIARAAEAYAAWVSGETDPERDRIAGAVVAEALKRRAERDREPKGGDS